MIGWLPDSTSTPEFVWFLTGALPLIVDLRFVWKLWRARRQLRDDGKNGADDIEIVTHIGRNVLIAAGHALIAIIGIAAMVLHPVVSSTPEVTPTGVVITLGLFGVSVILSLKTWWNNWRWRVSIRYAQDHHHPRDTVSAAVGVEATH